MNKRLVAVTLLLMGGCGPAVSEDPVAKLESLRREQYANIARQEGECRAVAIEFQNDPVMNQNCRDTYWMLVETARETVRDIDARLSEIRRINCSKGIDPGC